MAASFRHGLFVLLEKLLRWCVDPRLRAALLRMFGARIGKNVRIYEVQLFNLKEGFRNLHVADNVHIGIGCRLDLEGTLTIGARSTLSPGVTIFTHQDPGSAHGSNLLDRYPARVSATTVGNDCWLGANSVLLAGITLTDLVVVAAGCVVTKNIAVGCLAAGNPAQIKKVFILGGSTAA